MPYISQVILLDGETYDLKDQNAKTYSLSGSLSSNTFITTLTPSSGSASTATIPAMGAAGSSTNGSAGLVPAPSSGNELKFLRADATWQTSTVITLKTWQASTT